jgi:K+ transporter
MTAGTPRGPGQGAADAAHGSPSGTSWAVVAVAVLGILSLMFWIWILIVSLKYRVFVLQGDHRGEGGTFALLALRRPDKHRTSGVVTR